MNQLELELQPEPSYRLIPLSQGKFAKVDAEDFEWLSQWNWHVRWDRHTKSFYAERRETRFIDGKRAHYKMHRVILNVAKGVEVDHANRDTLDNQRGNLRAASRAQNAWNMKTPSTNTSGIKGVCKGYGDNWTAQIMANGNYVRLGSFSSKEEAKQAYVKAAAELHGEFARL